MHTTSITYQHTPPPCSSLFSLKTTAPTSIYTLSLHDALPIFIVGPHDPTDRFTYWPRRVARGGDVLAPGRPERAVQRSEEHTSELQSRRDLVCRLLLEKKKKNKKN